MKYSFVILLMISLNIVSYSSQGTLFENIDCDKNYVDYVSDEKGTIQLISPKKDWYVIVPDYDDTQRFVPTQFPDIFKKNGLRVIFSGKICQIPENVRLIGIPLVLTSIEKLLNE